MLSSVLLRRSLQQRAKRNALGDHKATANTMRLLSITLLTATQALRPLVPLRKLTSKLRKAPVVQAAPSGASLKPYLSQLIEGEDLNKDDAKGLFGAFLDGSASPEQVAAVLCCLRQKGETPDEIAGAAEALSLIHI